MREIHITAPSFAFRNAWGTRDEKLCSLCWKTKSSATGDRNQPSPCALRRISVPVRSETNIGRRYFSSHPLWFGFCIRPPSAKEGYQDTSLNKKSTNVLPEKVSASTSFARGDKTGYILAVSSSQPSLIFTYSLSLVPRLYRISKRMSASPRHPSQACCSLVYYQAREASYINSSEAYLVKSCHRQTASSPPTAPIPLPSSPPFSCDKRGLVVTACLAARARFSSKTHHVPERAGVGHGSDGRMRRRLKRGELRLQVRPEADERALVAHLRSARHGGEGGCVNAMFILPGHSRNPSRKL